MKSLYTTLLIMGMLLCNLQITAQGQQPDYTLQSSSISFAEKTINVSSTLTKSENTIKWDQYSNGMVESSVFLILGTSGTWDSQSNTGQLVYTLSIEEASGTLTVIGDASGLSATLLVNSEAGSQNYSFQINSITYL